MKFTISALFSLFIFQINYAQYTDIVNSNRPSESISAFAVGRTVIQLEGGLGYNNETFKDFDYKANGFSTDLSIRYGFLKEQLETVLDLNYQSDKQVFSNKSVSRNGLRASTIGLKYLIYDPFKFAEENVDIYSWKENNKFRFSQLIPIVSVYAGMNLNFSNNDFLPFNEKLEIISPKAMLITQNIFGKQYVFITNVYLDKMITKGQTLGYLLTLTRGFNEEWSAFVEYKGLSSDYLKNNYLSGGGAYLLNSNLQIDASVSKSIKNSPSTLYAGLGVTWRSDTNYKDFLVKTPEKNKNDKAKKAKKKKQPSDKKLLDKLPTQEDK